MKRIILAAMMVVLAMPAWGDGGNYERSEENKKASEGMFPKDCKGPVEEFITLARTNPFDNKGRCFKTYVMKPLQIFSRNKGLYYIHGASEPFAFVDFGKNSAPMVYFAAIVKGAGAYQYTTVNGSLMTVHKLTVLKMGSHE